jgi:hypothetical protein
MADFLAQEDARVLRLHGFGKVFIPCERLEIVQQRDKKELERRRVKAEREQRLKEMEDKRKSKQEAREKRREEKGGLDSGSDHEGERDGKSEYLFYINEFSHNFQDQRRTENGTKTRSGVTHDRRSRGISPESSNVVSVISSSIRLDLVEKRRLFVHRNASGRKWNKSERFAFTVLFIKKKQKKFINLFAYFSVSKRVSLL